MGGPRDFEQVSASLRDDLHSPVRQLELWPVVERIRTLQDFLERPFVFETPSPYVGFTGSTMSEWEFISRMAEDANCGLLLDVNNVYVSSVNHDFDPEEYIRSVPHERVVQFHLAGHTDCQTHLIDTHDSEVIDPVWKLYRLAHRLTGGVSTLLEWDASIPPFPVVHAEVLKARQHIGDELADSVMTAPPAFGEPIKAEKYSRSVPHPLHHVAVEVE